MSDASPHDGEVTPRCAGVAVVEFDIDRGSVVRLQHPAPIPVAFHCLETLSSSPQAANVGTPGAGPSWSSYLTDQLIPDGTERYDFALTWLAVNRPAVTPRASFMTSLFAAGDDGSWSCSARFCALIIENGTLALIDCQGKTNPQRLALRELSHHPMPCAPPALPSLPSDEPKRGRRRFKDASASAVGDELNDDEDGEDDRAFVMLKSRDSVAAVLFNTSGDFETFAARVASFQADAGTQSSASPSGMLTPVASPTRSEPGPLTGPEAPLFALSCAMTKKDASVRRGSINKGVAVFSDRVEWLHCLVPMLEVAVDALCCVRGWTPEAQSVQEAITNELFTQIENTVLPQVRKLNADRDGHGVRGMVQERCLQDRSHSEARVTFDKRDFYRHLRPTSPVPEAAAVPSPAAALSPPAREVAEGEAPSTPEASGSYTAELSREPSMKEDSVPSPSSTPPSAPIIVAEDSAGTPLSVAASPKLRSPQKPAVPAAPLAVCNIPLQVSTAPVKLTVSALPSRAVDSHFRVPVVVELFDAVGSRLPQTVLAAALDKRIMVLARHIVATRVSNACMGVGAPLLAFEPNVLARRVFPYSGITSTSHFEGRDGYIVGTLNPIFESTKPKRWWDLLLDIERKELTCTDPDVLTVTDRLAEPLAVAGRRLATCVGRHRAVGGSDVMLVETECRAALVEMLQQCLSLAATDEHATACAPLLRSRIGTAWALGKHGSRDVRPTWWVQLADCPQEDPNALVSVLQRGLRSTSTADELYALLLSLPGGSIEPLGELLLHRDPVVVLLAVTLMRRIDSDPVGRQCVSQLNSFLLFSYEQLKREIPDTNA